MQSPQAMRSKLSLQRIGYDCLSYPIPHPGDADELFHGQQAFQPYNANSLCDRDILFHEDLVASTTMPSSVKKNGYSLKGATESSSSVREIGFHWVGPSFAAEPSPLRRESARLLKLS